MGAEKAAIKAATIHEVGAAVDDRLEAARREQQQLLGQKMAFASGVRMVQQLHSNVDAEVTAGRMDLPQAAVAKLWVSRSMEVLRSLGLKADAMSMQHQGKVEALEGVVADLGRRYGVEKTRAEAPDTPPEGATSRQEGEHPGPGPKAVRMAEEAQEAPQQAAATKKRKKPTPSKG